MKIVRRIREARLVRDTEGLSTVEYVIILALIAACAVGTWKTFGEKVEQYVSKSNGRIDSNMPTFAKGD
jgi:Flp pilus assembly pilin Flp